MTQSRDQDPARWPPEERWRILMENVRDFAIFMLDAEGKIATWNEGAERILGYTEDEILGQDFKEIFTPEDIGLQQPAAELETATKTGRAEDERWHLRKDRTRFWAAGIVTCLRDESGNLRGFAKILRDITDRKIEQERLKTENRQKDEFLAMLSHELRNPLSAISNGIEFLRMSSPERPEHDADTIAILNRQTKALSRLVDDLLDVSRINTGKMPLRRKRVNIQDIIREAIAAIQHAVDSGEHLLDVRLPTEQIVLDADAERLQQVVGNLLSNAVKFSTNGTRIHLRAERVGNELLVAVRDEGVGIPQEMLPRIFDMFVQADRTLDRSRGGLGIGLSIVQRIAQMHGGRVDAASEGVGRGSEFTLRLPVIADVEAEGAADKVQPAGETRRILIAEDNKDSAATLGLFLHKLGHEVKIVHDGASAIQAATASVPDAILLDIGLPVLDGYEVAKRIRQHETLRNCTLIAVTGYGTTEDVHRAIAAGFNHHLVKPVQIEDLKKLLAASGSRRGA